MKLLLKNNISTLLILYIIVLLLLNVLPINGKDSTLNNNYILHIRWDYLGHFAAYGLLGGLGFLFAKAKQINPAIAVFLLLSLAVSAELLQKLIFWRTFNINDLAANLMGTIMGTLGIMIFLTFNRKYRWVR